MVWTSARSKGKKSRSPDGLAAIAASASAVSSAPPTAAAASTPLTFDDATGYGKLRGRVTYYPYVPPSPVAVALSTAAEATVPIAPVAAGAVAAPPAAEEEDLLARIGSWFSSLAGSGASGGASAKHFDDVSGYGKLRGRMALR